MSAMHLLCIVRNADNASEAWAYRTGVKLYAVTLTRNGWYDGERYIPRHPAYVREFTSFAGESAATTYARVEAALRPATAGASVRFARRTGLDAASVRGHLGRRAS